MAADDNRDPRFHSPVLDTIKACLISPAVGMSDMLVKIGEAIDRDGTSGAAIQSSRQIPSVANKVGERTDGGALRHVSWRNSDGHLVVRHRRATLIGHFDVTIWSGSMGQTCSWLYDLIANLPNDTRDGMLFSQYDPLATPPADRVPLEKQGNPIVLSCISPIFPEVRTSTGKTYKGSLIVRAEGAVWTDMVRGVPVTPKFLEPTFLS